MYEKREFVDPDGHYAMHIPSHWKFAPKEESGKKALHQFEIPNECVFQISCNPINERISKVIERNGIVPHDFNLPNISFIENFFVGGTDTMYTWMALINGQFYFATYYYNPDTKNPKEVGLDLMDVRMALRFLKILDRSDVDKEKLDEHPGSDVKDYMDIRSWRDIPVKFLNSISDRENRNDKKIVLTNVDVLRLYALLISQISQQPNGFFDLLKVGKPMDNMIWWDFVMECERGFIQVWRTPFVIEVSYSIEGEFDLPLFLDSNIKGYQEAIDVTIKSFDRHIIYINHYQSYSQCVETLWDEIAKIDLAVPNSPRGHLQTKAEMEKYTEELASFTGNSVKYHALAKSLVLNAAFKVESFLNLIIRIGCSHEMRLYPEVLSRFTKQDFHFKVKNLGFYTQILVGDVNMQGAEYREAKELMTLRNKYVHYEEDSTHNRLGEIFYDRDYPLHPASDNRPGVQTAIQTYHHPSISEVVKAYHASNNFIKMIINMFDVDLKKHLLTLLDQNPIGYNETKGMYSAIYMPWSIDFFTGLEE